MAKSNSFFSIRRGSTKSHTYSGWQGQQVTKDRVVTVKNPRSAAQQEQRQKFAAVGNFYKYLKFILNHSWEGVSYGVNSYNKFMSINVKNFDKESMIIPEYGSKVAEAGTYQVSEGSLADPTNFKTGESEDSWAVTLPIVGATVGAAAALKVSDLKNQLFKNDEDYVTLVGLYETVEPDGSPNINYQTKGFAVRFHRPSAADETAVNAENINTLLSTELVNMSSSNITFAYTAGAEDRGPQMIISVGGEDAEKYIQCFAVIGSKSDGGSSAILRSTSFLKLTDPEGAFVAAENANNAESWPVGADYLLNGETVTPTKG